MIRAWLHWVKLAWACNPIKNPAFGEQSTLKKHVTSTSSKSEPGIQSHDTGQQIPCIDRCRWTVTWMSNIKDVGCKIRLHDLLIAGVWPPWCNIVFVFVVIGCTCLRSISLVMLSTKKELHGFLFLDMHMCFLPFVMVLCLAAQKFPNMFVVETNMKLRSLSVLSIVPHFSWKINEYIHMCD